MRTANEIVPGRNKRKAPLALLLIVRIVVYSHEMRRYLYWNAECRRSSGSPASLWGGGAHSPTPQIQKRMTDRLPETQRSDHPHIPSRIWEGGVFSIGPDAALGYDSVTDCEHAWRRLGPSTQEVASYATWIEETFSESQLRSLTLQGGTIIRQRGWYTMLRSKCRGDRCAVDRANSSSPTSIIPCSRPNIQR